MTKDEFDGWVQKNQKKVVVATSAAIGLLTYVAVQATCLAMPEGAARDICMVGAPMAQKAAVDAINAQSGPELCEESRCTAIAGPAYSLALGDGGVCRCVSR